MNPNYEYFMDTDLKGYSGDWIIIVKKKVMAHGPRIKMKEMLREIKEAYPGESFLMAKVPKKEIQIL